MHWLKVLTRVGTRNIVLWGGQIYASNGLRGAVKYCVQKMMRLAKRFDTARAPAVVSLCHRVTCIPAIRQGGY